MKLSLTGGRVLQADGTITETRVDFDGGEIQNFAQPDTTASRSWDVSGHLVLPAIVDLHGGALERHMISRPGGKTSPKLALQDSDRQLVANGIATAYHAITYSWEPGLRGRDAVVGLLEAAERMRPHLMCDTRVHLRWEQYNTPGAADVAEWMKRGKIDLLAFNDHMNLIRRALADPQKLAQYAARAGLTVAAYLDLVDEVETRTTGIRAKTEWLAMLAGQRSISCTSHGDGSPDIRADFARLGAGLCASPRNTQTARHARHMETPVMMGAPDVLRGRDLGDRLCATTAVEQGLCSILTSDDDCPSLLQAPFKLAAENGIDFATAWNMVSKNPATAARLQDRGQIKPGQRADVVVVDDKVPGCPQVVATFVAGQPVHLIDAGYRMCA